MTTGAPTTKRPCRDDCGTDVILARRQPEGRWAAFEATDRPPSTQEAIGCWVLVGEQAWRPRDLVEHFQVTREISEERARELAGGHPWHRPHFHPTDERTSR